MSPASGILFAILGGVLQILIFPDFNQWFLAPLAITPLVLIAAREPGWRRRLVYGEIAGVVYWFGVCRWIQFVLAFHGGMSEGLAWFAFALFCLVKSLHMAAFTCVAWWLVRTRWALLLVPALWVGIERTHGPLGFPWLALGNAASGMGVPMRLAPVTGVYGVSFALAMMACGVAMLLLRRRFELAPLLLLPGLYLLPELPGPAPGGEFAAVVQPNVPQSEPWDFDKVRALESRLAVLSLEAALPASGRHPAMLIWPESPAPLYFETDPLFQQAAKRLATTARTHFLFGTVGYTNPAGGEPRSPLNSAVLLDPAGKPVSQYDKVNLVPFGEFVPPLFSWVNRVTKEAGDFEPGSSVVVSQINGHAVGTFICYESAFPYFVRQFAASGAELLVNISNDGYFGKSAARHQHLLLARMRAAENARWILRPTNDGVTVAIDPAGRLTNRLPPLEQVAGRLPFSWISETTPYTRHGDWFAWSCLLIAAAALAPRLRGSRSG